MKKVSNKESGFTIIEVVLVLAIAGLIFLVVFLALPALQRSQRDTQRRSDLGRMLASLETYAANNNGTYPTAASMNGTFVPNYMTNGGSSWADPQTGSTYTVTAYTAAVTGEPAGVIYYNTNRTCGATEGTMTAGGGTRSVAAITLLENGLAYCQDNR